MASTCTAHGGYRHELVLAATAAQVTTMVRELVCEGLARGGPTVVLASSRTVDEVQRHVGPGSPLTVLPTGSDERRPASDLRLLQTVLAGCAPGGERVRVVNEMPKPGSPSDWHEWRRYEAAVNIVLERLPVEGYCVYDRSSLSPARLGDLMATHPLVRTGDDDRPSDAFQDPAGFLDEHFDAAADPVEATPPSVELSQPSPAAARSAVEAFGRRAGLADDTLETLVLAANEAVSNAMQHGRPPVRVRLWTGPDRVVVTVRDAGPGPRDPALGLLRQREAAGGGTGLWVSHQLAEVAHRREAEGYTLRIVVPI